MKMRYALAFLALSLCFFACGDDENDNGNMDDDTMMEMPEPCACGTADVEFPVADGLVYMPNAFTPNGNGINDIFLPWASSNMEEIESYLIEDSTGTEIFAYYNFVPNSVVNGSWDGTVNDEIYTGQFSYTVKARNTNGVAATFSGSACSFLCDGTEEIMNPDDCKFGTQHDGEGGYDKFSPTLEDNCF